MELDLTEIEVPPSDSPTARVLEAGQEPVYAIIRQEGQTHGHFDTNNSAVRSHEFGNEQRNISHAAAQIEHQTQLIAIKSYRQIRPL